MTQPITVLARTGLGKSARLCDVVAMAEASGAQITEERPRSEPAWRAALPRVPLFAGLTAGDFDKLASCAHERRMRRGDVLIRAGDPGLFMMIIIQGEVRVLLSGVSGREQIVSTLSQGAIVGEIALLDGKARSADVVASTNGSVLVIERGALLRFLEQDPHFALRVIEGLCGRLRSTLLQLDSMVFQDVATRLASSLLSLAQGKAPRRLDMTQAALGQLVGASREIVNKRLRALEAQGIVALSPGRIVLLDETRLAQSIPGGTARL